MSHDCDVCASLCNCPRPYETCLACSDCNFNTGNLHAENALLKKKLEIAMAGLDEYGDGKNWHCSVSEDYHGHDENCYKDYWISDVNGYELARRIKAEIEEVK